MSEKQRKEQNGDFEQQISIWVEIPTQPFDRSRHWV
jgi:hypothetical protein